MQLELWDVQPAVLHRRPVELLPSDVELQHDQLRQRRAVVLHNLLCPVHVDVLDR
jgi:hypothetical protein